MIPCIGELEELYQVFWWILLKLSIVYTKQMLQMLNVRFSPQNRIRTYKSSRGGKKVYFSFSVSILLFFTCNESSFHPSHREVTRQALFTEKPQHQSLPSLSAPKKKPNFSCCNWCKPYHSHCCLEANTRLQREYDRTIAKRRHSSCSDGNKSSFSVPELTKTDGLWTHSYPCLHKNNVSCCTSAIFIYLFHILGI